MAAAEDIGTLVNVEFFFTVPPLRVEIYACLVNVFFKCVEEKKTLSNRDKSHRFLDFSTLLFDLGRAMNPNMFGLMHIDYKHFFFKLPWLGDGNSKGDPGNLVFGNL